MSSVRFSGIGTPDLSSYVKLIRPLIVILIALYVVKSSVIFIPAGFTAAVYDRGIGVRESELTEGINFLIPWWQTAQLFDSRIQEYTMAVTKDRGAVLSDDSLDAPTSDGQQVKVDVTILFRIDPAKASDIYKNIGPNYIDKIVRPIVRSQTRMIVSRYSAPDIYSDKRQEAETVMQQEISQLLKDKFIILDKVLLRAVMFSPKYSDAIEAKVIAEQRIKQAVFEVEEAKRRAEAKIAEAKGLAEAQALQKQSLTQEYLQLEAIKKWNGVMPSTLAGDTLPFLNIGR